MREWSTVTSSVAALVRDVLTPLFGLALVVAESRRSGEPRWELICLYAGMIGVPSIAYLDWRHRGDQPVAGPAIPPPAPSPVDTPS